MRLFVVATRLSAAVLMTAAVAFVAAPAANASGTFTPGDLIIYETQGTTSASQPVDLVDFSTGGTPSGASVALPTTASGGNFPLVESGAALNDGELTLSPDGKTIIATGYDAATGVASITSATNTPRTVALVSVANSSVDTSTVLSDTTTEGQNFRSATNAGGSSTTIYTGGGAGAGFTTDGGSAATYLNSDKVHEVQIVNGTLYESTTTNINQVGTAGTLPTSGTQTDTALITGANLPAHFGPDEFAFVTLGSGPGPDTLYVADGSNGATSGDPNAVEKYSLESGVWTATGSITVPLAVGLAASVSGGVASIYVTGATASSNGNNTVLYGITDRSGFGGTLSGTATTLGTAPTGTDFKGLVILPPAPGTPVPETPFAVLLPLSFLAILAAGFLVSRRRVNR
ncbi:MAG TPA: hypothetical protein VHT30_12930 [Acidimicrobiales bacterium]|nr:hypothetical protein [Acidimicrobiales bacterium]